MNKNSQMQGHIAALLTIFIWGTTYISTKVLLDVFTPIEILLTRFVMGLAAIFIVYPHFLKTENYKQEIILAMAGLCGICLYYLLENIALTMTYASNVGIISSIVPFFTAIIGMMVYRNSERINKFFIIGFIVAMIGMYLLIFNDKNIEINPLGDLLAVLATIVWAIYSNLIKKITTYGFKTILVTQRVFLYGIIFMLPAVLTYDINLNMSKFCEPIYLGNLAFLGLGASALCFVTWNYSVKILGAVKTSIYIYMVPIITVVSAVIILNEPLTSNMLLGAGLTMLGLFISEAFHSGTK